MQESRFRQAIDVVYLGETENIINEEKHILTLCISEVLSHSQTCMKKAERKDTLQGSQIPEGSIRTCLSSNRAAICKKG